MLEVDSKNDTIVTMSIEKVPFTKRCMNLYINIKWGIHTHTEAFTAPAAALYTNMSLRIECLYRQMLLQTAAFAHRCLCARMLLHRRLYTQMRLHARAAQLGSEYHYQWIPMDAFGFLDVVGFSGTLSVRLWLSCGTI